MATISERVSVALGDESSVTAARDYLLEAVRENAKSIEESFSKLGRAVLVFCVAYELLKRASLAEMSFGGMKITDLSLVQKALPLAIAYLYNRLIATLAIRRFLQELHFALVEKLYPSFVTTGLWRLALPGSNEAVNFAAIGASRGQGAAVLNLSIPEAAATILGPFLFWCYAVWTLFSGFGERDIFVWAVAVLSIPLLVQAFLLLGHMERLAPSNT